MPEGDTVSTKNIRASTTTLIGKRRWFTRYERDARGTIESRKKASAVTSVARQAAAFGLKRPKIRRLLRQPAAVLCEGHARSGRVERADGRTGDEVDR